MENKDTMVLDAILAMAKAWFTYHAVKLGWDKIPDAKYKCKTFGCNYGVMSEVEDTASNIDNRLVIEIGLFHDCNGTETKPCEDDCSEVESIQFSIGGECDTYDDLVLWMEEIHNLEHRYMPDFMR